MLYIRVTFETTSFFPLTSLPLFKGVKNDMKTLKCMLTDFEMKNPLKISQEVKEGRKKNFQPNTFNNNNVKKMATEVPSYFCHLMNCLKQEQENNKYKYIL